MSARSDKEREIRKFGAVAFALFGCLFSIGLWRQKAVVTFVFGTLCLLGLGMLLLPVTLRPIYVGWLKTSHLIGVITTKLLLALVYYLVITPTALIKRIFGGRPIPTAPDPNVSSYWVSRSEPAQTAWRFPKRF